MIPSEAETLTTEFNEGEDRAPARDWPRQGDVVTFHPRPGEARRGRTAVPAFLLDLDQATGLATILAFFESDDLRTIVRCPERSADAERGWAWDGKPTANADQFSRAVLEQGIQFQQLIEQVNERVASLTARLNALEAASGGNATQAKRKASGKSK